MSEDEDYPLELALDVAGWVLLFPMAITENSTRKWVRVFGFIMVFPFVITWVITAIPYVLFALSCIIWQLIKDI